VEGHCFTVHTLKTHGQAAAYESGAVLKYTKCVETFW